MRISDARRCLSGWLTCCGLGLLLASSLALAQQAVPALSGHVLDRTNTLSAAQSQQIERKLAAFEQERGAQVVVLLIATTQPEDIASYANRVANVWKIGRRDIGDGLLLIVAKDDRKVRIEVAKSLEGAIPDLAAKRIIDQALTPHFKQGDFAGGIDAALGQIMALVTGEALPAPKSAARHASLDFDWMNLAIFVFLAVPVLGGVARRILGAKLGALTTGGAVGALALLLSASLLIAALAGVGALLFTLLSNSSRGSGITHWGTGGGSWGGGGFGSDGGGGFSSGGGGDFGGGGASGDW